jgi:Flp pilus assembly protein TadG
MTPAPLRSALPARLRRFTSDERGVSAVEFAILLPLMLTLYLGGVEITQAVSADRKTTVVAHTVGDLTAQAQNVTSADMTNILNAASAIAYPFAASNLAVTVSSVCIDSTGTKATVAWSKTFNGTARSGTVTSMIPPDLMIASTSLIWSETAYKYRPTIGWTITGTLTLHEKFYLRPRLSSSVTLDAAAGCP